eukprot:12888769-Prorocentrum_lima.AAC.1
MKDFQTFCMQWANTDMGIIRADEALKDESMNDCAMGLHKLLTCADAYTAISNFNGNGSYLTGLSLSQLVQKECRYLPGTGRGHHDRSKHQIGRP